MRWPSSATRTRRRAAFRAAAHRISLIVAAEALRDLPTEAGTVATPLGPADARIVRADIVIVPVLRAGLGMVESILELVPRARVGPHRPAA